MLRTSLILGGLLALGVTTGCYAGGRAGVSASYSTPDMVYVSPGVQVVANYDRPVFYSHGYYWLYTDGLWLRSRAYNRGFIRVRTVPVVVRRIQRPHRYVRVRPHQRNRAPARAQRRNQRRF